MSRRRQPKRPASPPPKRPLVEQLPAVFAGALVALVVLAALLPLDTSPAQIDPLLPQWNNVVPLMLWLLLLLAWVLAGVGRGKLEIVLDHTTLAVLALTAIPALSAAVLIFGGTGNGRTAANLAWQWASFGWLFLLARQWLREPLVVRAVVAVMLATAAALATLALVQYAWLMPQTRAKYERNPEAVLRESQIVAEPGSPERRHFEDRLASTEPTATFALTNSLAGVLAPWLVLATGLAVSMLLRQPERPLLWRFLPLLIVLGLALLLTKSRTAVLATMLGMGLVVLYLTPLGRRVDVRIPLAIGLVAVVLVMGGIVSGGLDVEVLSEAPKSVLYRFQYWQATAAMIADHPWLGVGPGNFQDIYTHYQLPEASENIADPHNLVLEIWAASGTIGVLALLTVVAMFVWQLRRADASTEAAAEAMPPATPRIPTQMIYAGALLGVPLAYGCGFLAGLMPDVWLLFAGLPAAVFVWWLVQPWANQGELTLTVLLAALVTLAINLLAAGGIGFPGVATSLWLLMALALAIVEQKGPARVVVCPHGVAIGLTIAVLLIGLVCYRAVYDPMLRGRGVMIEAVVAERLGHADDAVARWQEAARIDPLAPLPWLRLAAIWQHELLRQDIPEFREKFAAARQEALARDPHSYGSRTQFGHWHLQLYRQYGQTDDLQAAIEDYQAAVTRFPNNARLRAQLAWALHLAGQGRESAAEAEAALALDRRHDHEEYKLEKFQVFDPGPPPDTDQPAGPGKATAEQLIERLRKP